MLNKNSLRFKTTLFVIVFAFALTASLLTTLFFSSRERIRSRSQQQVDFYADLFARNSVGEIEKCTSEIDALKLQLRFSPISPQTLSKQGAHVENPIKNFVIGYPQKYAFLLVHQPDWPGVLRARAIKVFGGTVKAELIWTADSMWLSPKVGIKRKDLDKRFATVDGQIRYISAMDGKANISIQAAISIGFLLDKILREMNLPPEIEPVVTDTNGIVLYARKQSLLRQFIQRVDPEIAEALALIRPTKRGQERNSFILAARKLDTPAMFVVFRKNMSPEINRLWGTLARMTLFAAFILVIMLFVTQIILRRMTATFQHMESAAARVADGDFSQKIAVERKDEIGLLIHAFNEMVDRLNESYHSLRQVNVELEKKIDELTQTRAELSQKQRLALIGETISKISHEIQNKIGGVSIWVQNLEMQLQGNENTRVYLDEMNSALNSFMEMLANFKRFYREPQLVKSDVVVSQLIDAIVYQFNEEIKAKNLRITISNRVHTSICADAGQLEKALMNIFLNALYFSPNGGAIDITVKEEDGCQIISIADEGPGVSAAAMSKLFQPFFTTKASGSGLGLAIAHNVVRAHGGELLCEQREQGGAVFSIKIPHEGKDENSDCRG